MSETILSIVSGMFEAPQTLLGGTFGIFSAGKYEGYTITTNEQVIYLGIQEGQQCCEDSGYLMSEDDTSHYIGAELLNIQITDTARNKDSLSNYNFEWGGDTLFVDIETSKGVLQFVAYNEHNGYYGHSAIVVSNQLNHETVI